MQKNYQGATVHVSVTMNFLRRNLGILRGCTGDKGYWTEAAWSLLDISALAMQRASDGKDTG